MFAWSLSLWKQGLFNKPFQSSKSWHQLKDIVFLKWVIFSAIFSIRKAFCCNKQHSEALFVQFFQENYSNFLSKRKVYFRWQSAYQYLAKSASNWPLLKPEVELLLTGSITRFFCQNVLFRHSFDFTLYIIYDAVFTLIIYN